MKKFKKSESTLNPCAQLSFPIDSGLMQTEFEEKVKPFCSPSLSSNPKRQGWKRYVI